MILDGEAQSETHPCPEFISDGPVQFGSLIQTEADAIPQSIVREIIEFALFYDR